MNHQLVYQALIERAKNRILPPEVYVERHHIVPRCVGGTDAKNNIIPLTAREHFIAHQLLIHIYPFEYKLVLAAKIMCYSSHKNAKRLNSKEYSWIRERFGKAMKICQGAENNSQFGTTWISNGFENKKVQLTELDSLEDGWFKGKAACDAYAIAEEFGVSIDTVIYFTKDNTIKVKSRKMMLRDIERINNMKSNQPHIDAIRKLHQDYLDSNAPSLRKFVEQSGYTKSHVNLHNSFKKYVPDYVPKGQEIGTLRSSKLA